VDETQQPSSGAKRIRGPAYGLFLFYFLGAAAKGFHNPQVGKTHNETHNSAGSEQGCEFSEIDKTWSGYV
jgi:hypothetical protein